MGSWFSMEKPPPLVLVPPLFHRPELAGRYRMTQSSYDVLFGKLARKLLFEDYYMEAEDFFTRIMLKPPEDKNVDFIASFSLLPENGGEYKTNGEATFRWQGDPDNAHDFMELNMSTFSKSLKVISSTFNPQLGFGAFSSLSLLPTSRLHSNNENIVGLRYGSSNLSIGTMIDCVSKDPSCVWLVRKVGKITAGCQFKPQQREQRPWRDYFANELENPSNWSFAVDYGSGRSSPLNPSFNFCLEAQQNSKLIASYYHHLIVQRQVRNLFEGSDVIAITNYLDVGFEFQQSLGESAGTSGKVDKMLPAMQVGASWQANKNVLVKAKLGTLSSGLALSFKSWWQPSFMVSFSAVRDHVQMKTKVGLGIQVENFGGVSYEPADPNYVMVTPTKTRPMLQKDMASKNVAAIPAEFRPRATVL